MTAPTPMPSVTVTADYPATDGRAPERIEVRWETPVNESTRIAAIAEVIASLARVARERL